MLLPMILSYMENSMHMSCGTCKKLANLKSIFSTSFVSDLASKFNTEGFFCVGYKGVAQHAGLVTTTQRSWMSEHIMWNTSKNRIDFLCLTIPGVSTKSFTHNAFSHCLLSRECVSVCAHA